ncbi:HemK methyltransferase family member 2 [Cryptotermes secundus]|uniref:Methyltransferase HEMK2 n=1 Tax=Cryptotermes secundus TaxID=105785 RepID=A0A2J7QJN8_9NEOP|nr:methyltransferase N6AMT1 isoform X1 [Cryptotermes secundus]PNF28789.1 HemK methyltransferase family member 2 [Cryptotermes secundus]
MDTPSLSHLSVKDYAQIYEPAEDSFLLIDALEQDLIFLQKMKPSVCVEIGSGSGVVITAVAKALGTNSHCIAIDINPVACGVTQRTAQLNHTEVEVVTMDLMSGFHWDNRIDVLIFNPPYVVTPSEEILENKVYGDITRAWAGGERGREVMDRLFPMVPNLLSLYGAFYLVVISENCPDDIKRVMDELGFDMNIVKERKVRGEHLLVLKFVRK